MEQRQSPTHSINSQGSKKRPLSATNAKQNFRIRNTMVDSHLKVESRNHNPLIAERDSTSNSIVLTAESTNKEEIVSVSGEKALLKPNNSIKPLRSFTNSNSPVKATRLVISETQEGTCLKKVADSSNLDQSNLLNSRRLRIRSNASITSGNRARNSFTQERSLNSSNTPLFSRKMTENSSERKPSANDVTITNSVNLISQKSVKEPIVLQGTLSNTPSPIKLRATRYTFKISTQRKSTDLALSPNKLKPAKNISSTVMASLRETQRSLASRQKLITRRDPDGGDSSRNIPSKSYHTERSVENILSVNQSYCIPSVSPDRRQTQETTRDTLNERKESIQLFEDEVQSPILKPDLIQNDSKNHIQSGRPTNLDLDNESLNTSKIDLDYPRSQSLNPTVRAPYQRQPPRVSASSWVLFDGTNSRLISGKQERERREIASLTKIMTCYLAIDLAERMKLDLNTFSVTVSKIACSMFGTTARLREGDVLKLIDLLHALMLPSGNDAAVAIAEGLGKVLKLENEKKLAQAGAKENTEDRPLKSSFAYFIEAMNQKAAELELIDTHYSNPHGLSHSNNLSSAYDVARLCITAMKNEIFRKIVRKKEYTCTVFQGNRLRREMTWENTNKLLGHGYEGVKTGITPTAGPCLASSLRRSKDRHLICVLLNASDLDTRFSESRRLMEYGERKMFHKAFDDINPYK